jgi:putative PIN family toxin of toxin-antitoxin system
MQSKKIIIDTNIWINFLITKDLSFLDKFIDNGKLKLIFSNELYSEFLEVTERPKFKKYFHKSDIQRLTHIIDKFGILIEVTSQIEKCRDIKDDFLLNLAIDSNADFLVTGDLDLLEIKQISNTKILKIKELEKILTT